MNKIKKIFQSTLAKLISLVLIIGFIASIFLYLDAYKRQYNRFKGYWYVYRGDVAFKQHKYLQDYTLPYNAQDYT